MMTSHPLHFPQSPLAPPCTPQLTPSYRAQTESLQKGIHPAITITVNSVLPQTVLRKARKGVLAPFSEEDLVPDILPGPPGQLRTSSRGRGEA